MAICCNFPSKCDLCGTNSSVNHHIFLIASLIEIYGIDLVQFCKFNSLMTLITFLFYLIVVGLNNEKRSRMHESLILLILFSILGIELCLMRR